MAITHIAKMGAFLWVGFALGAYVPLIAAMIATGILGNYVGERTLTHEGGLVPHRLQGRDDGAGVAPDLGRREGPAAQPEIFWPVLSVLRVFRRLEPGFAAPQMPRSACQSSALIAGAVFHAGRAAADFARSSDSGCVRKIAPVALSGLRSVSPMRLKKSISPDDEICAFSSSASPRASASRSATRV